MNLYQVVGRTLGMKKPIEVVESEHRNGPEAIAACDEFQRLLNERGNTWSIGCSVKHLGNVVHRSAATRRTKDGVTEELKQ